MKTLVFKVGTSTLIHPSGRVNLRRMEQLCKVLSDLANEGNRVVLVTSGAIGVGVGKLRLPARPADTAGKQAAATVGQSELMFLYDKFFSQFGHIVGQLLITKEDVQDDTRRKNLTAAFDKLFQYGAVPIINENDAVAVDEIVYGDNDSLSAVVAALIHADTLLILTETGGLYNANPQLEPSAKLLSVVPEVTDKIRAYASGSISGVGTGGMTTKVQAADFAARNGIDTYIFSGKRPDDIYRILAGDAVGTHFLAKKD